MSDFWFGTSGPRDARIMIVGESWGQSEEFEKLPFVGESGREFTRILADAGIDRASCFLTNVVSSRPPRNEMWRFFAPPKAGEQEINHLHPLPIIKEGLHALYQQIEAVKPDLLIAAGNYALWALATGTVGYGRASEPPPDYAGQRVPTGIDSWRGSMLYCTALAAGLSSTKLLPIYHPAGILRQWSWRAVTVHDLKSRVPMALARDWRPIPEPRILAPPAFAEARDCLATWLQRADRASGDKLRLAHDIENTLSQPRFMTCASFAEGGYDAQGLALVIPFIRLKEDKSFESYWPFDEELELLKLQRRVLTHPNILIEGQNYLHDTQWEQREHGITPRLDFDTMLAHHLLFPGTPKSLDYISSLYCRYHRYWKDDNKEWDLKGNFIEHLRYNGEDSLRTYECASSLRHLIKQLGMEELWRIEKQKGLLALEMMNRGVGMNLQRRSELALELAIAADGIGSWLLQMVPQAIVDELLLSRKAERGQKPKLAKTKSLWFKSADQQKLLFSQGLGLKLPNHRKTGRMTFNADALVQLRDRHPEFTRLFTSIEDLRSINVFRQNFILAPLDHDQRMRCMFNTGGTETFRWSSSENAFGGGTNLQNIPMGDEE